MRPKASPSWCIRATRRDKLNLVETGTNREGNIDYGLHPNAVTSPCSVNIPCRTACDGLLPNLEIAHHRVTHLIPESHTRRLPTALVQHLQRGLSSYPSIAKASEPLSAALRNCAHSHANEFPHKNDWTPYKDNYSSALGINKARRVLTRTHQTRRMCVPRIAHGRSKT